jgi:DNA-binding response OmpR family regulator
VTESEGSKKRILVIEDEPTIGLLCRRVLTASGFDVDVVNNGLDAKKVADEKPFEPEDQVEAVQKELS